MSKCDLSGAWSFAYASTCPQEPILCIEDLAAQALPLHPCVVPGNFELDLCANGFFQGDPFFGMNIAELRQYETYHVWYGRRFDGPTLQNNRAILVFEGIDCISDIFVNGEWIGSTDNMLIPHEFDITDRLRADNEILVHIHPPGERALTYPYPPLVSTMPHMVDSTYIRKAPHGYGWDIMPRALSAGLWRPVSLELRAAERISNVYLATTDLENDRSSAALMLRYHIDLPVGINTSYEIKIEGRCGDSEFHAQRPLLFGVGNLELRVQDPELWWPRGQGAASLYDVAVHLLNDGTIIDTKRFQHGIRIVRLDRTTTTDSEGNGEFCFYLNHERVFAKGTNWVPADAYHSRDLERISRMLDLVDEIGCNMIRCWGGNVYENDLFFELCDRKGIMVWQDFVMACAIYPQDRDFQDRLAVEAHAVVQRLRQHASIVLWAGDNECDESWLGSPMHLDPNNNVLTRSVLPIVLREEDPFRPYLPSSPYLDTDVVKAGLSSMPEAHLWGVRHDHRANYFKEANCHFVSEIGFLSCPAVSSIQRFIPEDKLWPPSDNPYWTLHATSPIPGINLFDYRVGLLTHEVGTFFESVPDNLTDFVFATQVCQAEGMKMIIERFRSQMWRRTGVLWWNIIDGWPQFSDAVVDYYFEKKLAFDFIKRAQEPVAVVIREDLDRSLVAVAVNDTHEDVLLTYRIVDIESGKIVIDQSANAAKSSATFLVSLSDPGDARGMYRIEWTSGTKTGVNHFLYGKTPYDLNTYRSRLGSIYSADA